MRMRLRQKSHLLNFVADWAAIDLSVGAMYCGCCTRGLLVFLGAE